MTTATEISLNTAIKRINRKLANQGEKLCVSRIGHEKSNLGDFYIVDAHTNSVIAYHVDIETMGRELGIIAGHEAVSDY